MVEIKSIVINGENCFKLTENGHNVCACFYNPVNSEIIDLEEYDLHDVFFNKAVVKAVLNNLDLNGVETVFCKKKELGSLLTELGFIYNEAEEVYILNLKGYFETGCCKG